MHILTDLMEAVLGYMNFLSFDLFNIPRYFIDIHINVCECVYFNVCNIYVCIRTYIFKYLYVYTHICSARADAHTHTYTHAHTHTHTYTPFCQNLHAELMRATIHASTQED